MNANRKRKKPCGTTRGKGSAALKRETFAILDHVMESSHVIDRILLDKKPSVEVHAISIIEGCVQFSNKEEWMNLKLQASRASLLVEATGLDTSWSTSMAVSTTGAETLGSVAGGDSI